MLALASLSVLQLNLSYSFRVQNLMIFLSLSVFALNGGVLSPGIVFSTFAQLNFLRFSFSHFVAAMLYVLEFRVGYKRIKVKYYTQKIY